MPHKIGYMLSIADWDPGCQRLRETCAPASLTEERAMARYFFNVIDGQFLADHEGTECSSLEEARAQAIETAGAMMREAGRQLWDGTEWQMHVTDEDRRTLLKLRFSAEQLAWSAGTA